MLPTVGATPDSQGNSKQPYIVTDDDHMEAAMGRFVGGQQKEKLQMVHNTLVCFLMP
jgi:hypothetical protein